MIRDLRHRLRDLAAQLEALGSACTDYAAHVDTKRAELLSLLEDLVEELALGAILAGGLSFISAGAAAGAASGAAAARISSASTKARGILDGLRMLTAGPALSSRSVTVTAGEIGASTERINAARVMLTETSGQSARSRSSAGCRRSVRVVPDATRAGGATPSREHVGKTHCTSCVERLAKQPRPHVCVFTSRTRRQRARDRQRIPMSSETFETWLAIRRTA